MRIMRIILNAKGKQSLRFKEVEKILLNDGWRLKNIKGSHNHYVHPCKPGKVTIPNHRGDLDNLTVQMIMKQAGLR
jgi:predicted RNA binding protein YcfA (HicA-like mRNA interferase family)